MEKQLHTEIRALSEISSAVVRERNTKVLLEKVLEILHQKMGMLRGTFTLRHGDTFEIEVSHGLTDSEKKRGIYKIGEGITGYVAESGVPQLVPDIAKDKRFRNLTGSRTGQKNVAFLCVPIYFMEKIIGTLSIDRKITNGVDLDEDLRFLEIVGNLTAEAVGIAKMELEERESLLEENQQLRAILQSSKPNEPPGKLVGNCRSMLKIYEQIRQVATSNATVLIRGSSGTGKELVASAIHQLSHRRNNPFVALNCAALPESLVESELFGHEKGAFTGAIARRIGRAEAANGGTLFLDEVGDLTLQTQVKLLRFLQERTFFRVGCNKEQKSDVRILAATSRNLENLMEQGRFREDLYYRLNIFQIAIPNLSKRRCDIILLAEHFINKHNERYGKNIKRISTPAINMLMAYHWPGNVRELENCIERAVLTSTDECIRGHHLPPSLQMGNGGVNETNTENESTNFDVLVESFERERIVEALKKH
ncbi:MAG: sigma-54 interaction domain-containing protein, partial [Thermoguttaceae bacterium]